MAHTAFIKKRYVHKIIHYNMFRPCKIILRLEVAY
jgi:hypothetical protein